MRMTWGTCRMLFEARAEAYEASRHGSRDDGVREATMQDIDNWI